MNSRGKSSQFTVPALTFNFLFLLIIATITTKMCGGLVPGGCLFLKGFYVQNKY